MKSKPIRQLTEFEKGLKKTLDYLYDGNAMTVKPLLIIRNTYKQYPDIFNWLVKNDIKGQKLVEFFQNESPDGGGVHLGVTHILSKIKGHKNTIVGIKGNELL